MNYVPRGPKRPVNMTLSEDLAREARALTRNLPDTVEGLLAGYVEAARRQQAKQERQIDDSLRQIDAHQKQFGIWGEEFSTF